MHLSDFGILLLTWLTVCHAAPIIAPVISAKDKDLATAINVINIEDKDVMRTPRCGVEDVSKYEHFPSRPKWEKNVITYRITQYTPDLTRTQVDATIAQAFKLYSDVIPLDFKQIYQGTADIMILFQSRFHGDIHPFDGPRGVLAHAYRPGLNIGGDAHFDEDETWTLSHRDFNLLLVAAHEFGHSLGLDHSNDKNALMYKYYRYVNTNGYKLPDDDVRGVQALYGIRTTLPKPRPRPNPRPDPVPLPNPQDPQCCPKMTLDAAASIWGDLYYFKNGYYWQKSSSFPEIRFAKVSTTWPQISYVDAAFEVPSMQLACLFQDHQYWCMNALDKTILPGYPQPITNFGLPYFVSKVDAAIYEPTASRAYLFVNDQYWSYDLSRFVMDYGYPRYISQNFPGIGFKVDAALENNGYVYFIQGSRMSQYYVPYKRVIYERHNYEWLSCATG